MRTALAVLVAAALISTPLSGQGVEFETASLTRSTSNTTAGETVVASGEVRLSNVSMRTLVTFVFPLDAGTRILNLPPWADSERYDLIGRGKPGASIQDRQEMVRALLASRAALAAHYESREQEGYSLVMARDDGLLGPGLTRSTLDCGTPNSNTPVSGDSGAADLKARVMNRCNLVFTDPIDETSYAGGIRMDLLIRMIAAATGRPVVDRTGLKGFYAVRVRFQHSAVPSARSAMPDAPPSVFAALPEQLGLKLEPESTPVPTLVIDRLERPAQN
jgi:uncharacterized protein (TIGR03435 family)